MIGALVVEQMVDSRAPEGFRQRVDVVRSHSSSALTNALEYEGLFLMPVWRAIGKVSRKLFGRALPKTLSISAAVIAAIAALCLIPTDFTLEANGKLRPKTRQNIFAVQDGEIREIEVDDASPVKKDDILVVQESKELDKQREKLLGEMAEAQAEISSTSHAVVPRRPRQAHRSPIHKHCCRKKHN